jgi:Signal transduction histidine kinase regulating C4-dicarboxylate transport system
VTLRGARYRPSRMNLPTGQELLALLPVQDDRDRTDVPLEAIDIPVPLMRLRPDGTIRDANAHARRLIGAAQPEGRSLEEFLTGHGTSLAAWLQMAVKTPQTNHSEFLRLKSVEHETFIQVTLSRMTATEGSDLIIVMSDATELKSLEMQFVQSQKMQAIGQLAGGIAHDFNNLLTAISGHCDLLLMRYDEGDPEYPDLIQINQNANRAAALVGQLLAFSRKQNLVTEVLDLRNILADLAHLLNRLVGEKTRLVLEHLEE